MDLILTDVDAIMSTDYTSFEATFFLIVILVLWSFGEVVMVHVDSKAALVNQEWGWEEQEL